MLPWCAVRARVRPAPRDVRSERGQELIEFAFVSVLLLLMLFLILEGGIMVWRYNMLSNVAQEAARWAAVRGSQSSGTFNSTGTVNDVRNYVLAREPGVTVTLTPNVNPNTLLPGDSITVTVSRPMPSRLAFYTLTGTLTASASMRIAR